MCIHGCKHIHTQVEGDAKTQQDRADALEHERDAFQQQNADLREKLIKAQRDLDDMKNTMENTVPRCVCVCVCVYVYMCVCVDF